MSDGCEFGACLRQSDAVLYTAEDVPIVRCTAFIVWRINFARHPEVSVIREAEPLRHYADDRKNLVIGGKLELREIFRAAQVLLPIAMADQQHRRGAFALIFGIEATAEER